MTFPHKAAIQWGCDHESDAIQQYVLAEFPYLATSPDGVITIDNGRFGVIEVKYPFKHHNNSIEVVCKDTHFCLIIVKQC